MEHNADFTKTRGKLFLTGKEPSALTFILQSQGKTRAVRGMPPSERRSEILRLLCKRRHETAINLATEFGVSERTIRNDLVILSCYYPIQVTWGRYGSSTRMVPPRKPDVISETGNTSPKTENSLRWGGAPSHE